MSPIQNLLHINIMSRISTNLGSTDGLPKSNCCYCFVNMLLKRNVTMAILLVRNLNHRKTYITDLITCRKRWRQGLNPGHLCLWTCSYLCPSCLCEGNGMMTDQSNCFLFHDTGFCITLTTLEHALQKNPLTHVLVFFLLYFLYLIMCMCVCQCMVMFMWA